jgi:hypothetical protein
MENIGAILFAVFLYVITTEVLRFVARGVFLDRSRRRETAGGHKSLLVSLVGKFVIEFRARYRSGNSSFVHAR